MATRRPLVSVGVPVYNGARTLDHALDSILGQTLTDLEVIISDNASEDGTEELCRHYAARDPRVRYYRNAENLGARANYRRVVDLSTGKYFKWAAHDDWLDPEYLEYCVGALEAEPESVLAYPHLCRVDAEGDVSPKAGESFGGRRGIRQASELVRSPKAWRRSHDVLWKLPLSPIFGVFRRSALVQTSCIPNCPGPDRVTLFEAALIGPFIQINDVLFYMRTPAPKKSSWVWLDPRNKASRPMPVLRLMRALLGAVWSGYPFGPMMAVVSADVVISVSVRSVRQRAKKTARLRGNSKEADVRGGRPVESFLKEWRQKSAASREARDVIATQYEGTARE